MKDNEKQVNIEALSIKDPARRGILYEGKWHTVIGKASEYVSKLQKGMAIVSEDKDGNVTFVSQRDAPTQQASAPAKNPEFQGTYQKAKDDKITRMNTLDKAIDWVKTYRPDLKDGQRAIIQVQAMESYFRTFVETGRWPETGDVIEEDFEEE
jgi:hypothetical protein